jgi:hypothetical protein
MIIDRKKLYNALTAFHLEKEIKTRNNLLNYDIKKLKKKMNQIIFKENNSKKNFILEIYKIMILTFYYYYKLQKLDRHSETRK